MLFFCEGSISVGYTKSCVSQTSGLILANISTSTSFFGSVLHQGTLCPVHWKTSLSLSSGILWKVDSAQEAGETLGIHLLVEDLIQIPQCSRLLLTFNILKALRNSPAVWAGSTLITNGLEDKCTARTSVYKPTAWSRWTQPKAEQWDDPVPSLHSKNTLSQTLNLSEFARTNQSNRQLHL